MNLDQLRYAKAVAEAASFTLAAERCYVTQPTLSNGIAQLEQELGERLFARTTRSVTLTPFGRRVLPLIDNVLNAHDEFLRESRSFAHPSQSAVRIGTSPLIKPAWLSSMLEGFRNGHAGIEIILHENNMADLYLMLDDGILDFVFGVAAVRKASWSRAFLYREPLYYVPCGNNHVDGSSVSFDQIAGETFVMVPSVCGLARAIRALFRKHRRKLYEYPGEAMSYQVLEEWAALGLGAAILPKSKLQLPDRQSYLLTNKAGEELHLDFEAVWPDSPERPAHLQQFAEFLKTYREKA